MSIRDVLRFCYDTDTTELRILGGFGWIRLGLYEYGKIQLRYTTSSPKGNDRLSESQHFSHQNILNSSQVIKRFFQFVKGS